MPAARVSRSLPSSTRGASATKKGAEAPSKKRLNWLALAPSNRDSVRSRNADLRPVARSKSGASRDRPRLEKAEPDECIHAARNRALVFTG